jgi:P27 family predicted phage terminase small subunit
MRGRRPQLKPVEGGKSAAFAPPEHLPRAMHSEWRTIIADLQERGLLHPSMMLVLDSFVSSAWMVAECRKAIAKHGAFVKTKTGEPRAHPAAGMMSKHIETVARLGSELGLTPAARSRKALQGPEAPADGDDEAALGI